jgi:hypothetical protein
MLVFRVWGTLLLSVLILARPAAAQEEAKAAAVAAFDDARRLLDKKQIAAACEKFSESQRLDPQLGTLLHLANCLEQNGQTASAWARFRDASEIAAARKDRRQSLAEQRAAKLLPRLSKLLIEVDAGNELDELKIEQGNVVVGRALWGTATPTDPGTYSLEVTAPGRKPWSTSVVVPEDGGTATVRVPVLELLPKAERTENDQPRVPERALAPKAEERSWLSRRWPVIPAAAVGLAGVGVGTVFGLKSKQRRDEGDGDCDGRACTTDHGVTLREQAKKDGNVSTIAFAVGGVGLAAAGVLLLVLPGSGEPASEVALLLGPAGLECRGSF